MENSPSMSFRFLVLFLAQTELYLFSFISEGKLQHQEIFKNRIPEFSIALIKKLAVCHDNDVFKMVIVILEN